MCICAYLGLCGSGLHLFSIGFGLFRRSSKWLCIYFEVYVCADKCGSECVQPITVNDVFQLMPYQTKNWKIAYYCALPYSPKPIENNMFVATNSICVCVCVRIQNRYMWIGCYSVMINVQKGPPPYTASRFYLRLIKTKKKMNNSNKNDNSDYPHSGNWNIAMFIVRIYVKAISISSEEK